MNRARPKKKKKSSRKKSSKFDRKKQKRSKKRKKGNRAAATEVSSGQRRRSSLHEATEEILEQYRSRSVRPSFRKNQAEYGQSIRPLFSNGEDSSPTYRMHTDRNGQQRQNLPYHQNLLSKPPNVLNSMTTMHMQEVFQPNFKRDDVLDYGYFRQNDDSEEIMSDNFTSDDGIDNEFEAFCAQGHRLTPKFLSKFQCTLCERHCKNLSSYQCAKCKYDVCAKCYDKEEPTKPDDFQKQMKENQLIRNSRRISFSVEASPKHGRGSTLKRKKSQSRRNSSSSRRSNVDESSRRGSVSSRRNSSRKSNVDESSRRGSVSSRGNSVSTHRRNSVRPMHSMENYGDISVRHVWEPFDRDEEIEQEFEKPQLRNLDKDEYSIFGGIWIVTIPPINTNGEEVVVMQDGMVFSKGFDTGMRFDVHMCRLFSTIHNDVWQLVHIEDSGNNLAFHFNGESMILKRRGDYRLEELDAEQRNFYLTRPKRKRGKIHKMGLFSCMARSSSSTKSSKVGCFSF